MKLEKREIVKKRSYLGIDEISGEARSAWLGEAGDDGVHLSLQGAALVCLGLLLFFCLLLGSCVDLLDVLWVYSCLVTVWSLNKLG